MGRKLTNKQRRFVDRYLVHLNAPRAAKEAGYSSRSARNQAHRMMTNDDISAAIESAMKERSERLKISQDDVLRMLVDLVESNIGEICFWEKNKILMRDLNEIPRERLSGIKKLSCRETSWGRSISITMYDKVAALTLLGKHLGLFGSVNRSGVDHEAEEEASRNRLSALVDRVLADGPPPRIAQ